MLVLTRRPGESIMILCEDGTRIRIKVFAIELGRVKIGVEAPQSVNIRREEVHGPYRGPLKSDPT